MRNAIEAMLRWIVAALFAAGLGAALLGGTPAPPSAAALPVTRFPARVVFQHSAPDRMEVVPSTVIWSPVLFALPTPYGFSRLPLTEWTVGPPLDLPDPPQFSLAQPPTALAPRSFPLRPAVPPAWILATLLPYRTLPPYRPTMDALSGSLPEEAEWPLAPEEAGPAPWTASVEVRISPEGWPTGIWFDSTDAPTTARVSAVRRIASWRWPGAVTSRTVRLRLVHPGASLRREP